MRMPHQQDGRAEALQITDQARCEGVEPIEPVEPRELASSEQKANIWRE
jgi:hypothetical protein